MTTHAKKESKIEEQKDALEQQREGRRGIQFPWKLHELLEQVDKTGDNAIISWLPGGKAFKVHKKEEFCNDVMPAFFNSSKYKTFQRSLNLWGFESVVRGPEKGACYHRYFVRGHPDLCKNMMRVKIKGGGTAEAAAATGTVPSAPVVPQKPLVPGLSNMAAELPAAAALTKLASSTASQPHVPANISEYIRSKGGMTRTNPSEPTLSEDNLSLARRLSSPALHYPLSLAGLGGGDVFAPYRQLGVLPPTSGFGMGGGLGGPSPFLSTSRSRLMSAINTAAAALDVIRQEEAEILRRAHV